MTGGKAFGAADWPAVDFVVFDVDGTLYDQRPLRLRMARDLIFHTLGRADLRVARVLRAYRDIREEMGAEETERFQAVLNERVVRRTGSSVTEVTTTVSEWMDTRPLRYLASCRFPRIDALFGGLKRCGKRIGIFSDYPARSKLAALGLEADFVVSAEDEGVDILKPNPRGLDRLIERAQVSPERTLMIGDRCERDGASAMRAGARCLIRSTRPRQGWQTFRATRIRFFCRCWHRAKAHRQDCAG